MIGTTHKIRPIKALALVATVATSLLVLVPPASAGVRGDDRSGDRVDVQATHGADGAAATGSVEDKPLDTRDALGLALFLALLGVATVAMVKTYRSEKAMGWGSIGGGGRWG